MWNCPDGTGSHAQKTWNYEDPAQVSVPSSLFDSWLRGLGRPVLGSQWDWCQGMPRGENRKVEDDVCQGLPRLEVREWGVVVGGDNLFSGIRKFLSFAYQPVVTVLNKVNLLNLRPGGLLGRRQLFSRSVEKLPHLAHEEVTTKPTAITATMTTPKLPELKPVTVRMEEQVVRALAATSSMVTLPWTPAPRPPTPGDTRMKLSVFRRWPVDTRITVPGWSHKRASSKQLQTSRLWSSRPCRFDGLDAEDQAATVIQSRFRSNKQRRARSGKTSPKEQQRGRKQVGSGVRKHGERCSLGKTGSEASRPRLRGRFEGPDAEDKAAAAIQSRFRGKQQRRRTPGARGGSSAATKERRRGPAAEDKATTAAVQSGLANPATVDQGSSCRSKSVAPKRSVATNQGLSGSFGDEDEETRAATAIQSRFRGNQQRRRARTKGIGSGINSSHPASACGT